MLISLDDLLPLLRCPRTGQSLRIEDHDPSRRRLVTADGCHVYPFVGSHPWLVDYENSVLDEQAPDQPLVIRGRIAMHDDDPHPISRRNAHRFVELARASRQRPRVLIVGGGAVGSGSGPIYDAPDIDVVSLDVYRSDATSLVADAHSLPFHDASFDAVWIQAVLEHVLRPVQVVDEIRRVLRPGGHVYAETPLMQQVHEGAFDFCRFTENGHRFLFAWFDVVDSGVVLGPAVALRWSIRHFVRAMSRSETVARLAWLAFGWLARVDALCDPRLASDGASALYFLGRLAAAPVGPRRVALEYRGAQRGRPTAGGQGL